MAIHRVIEVEFTPSSSRQWKIHGAVRQEAARLWVRLTKLHAFIRRRLWRWPTYYTLARWAKGRFPGLSAQSVQQTIRDFIDAIESTKKRREKGANKEEAQYPWRTNMRYRRVVFTNQDPRFRGRRVLLPCGKLNGKRVHLSVHLPKGFSLLGKLCEIRLEFCKAVFVTSLPESPSSEEISNLIGPTIGIDPGVNTLLAVTDGKKALVISGRETKAITQLRNKQLGEINSKQSSHKKGSRRWRKLQKAKRHKLAKTKRKIRDIAHKATRAVVNAFPNTTRVLIGKAFNDAACKLRPKQAQTVSQAITGLLSRYLDYKFNTAASPNKVSIEKTDEHWTSQTCPVCGERHKGGRVYFCKGCGLVAPRDVVGSLNIRNKGMSVDGTIPRIAATDVPTRSHITYLRPLRCLQRVRSRPADTRHVAQPRS